MLEAEVSGSVVVADIFYHRFESLEISRNEAGFDVAADQVAQNPAEIFMARIGKKRARIGGHADKF